MTEGRSCLREWLHIEPVTPGSGTHISSYVLCLLTPRMQVQIVVDIIVHAPMDLNWFVRPARRPVLLGRTRHEGDQVEAVQGVAGVGPVQVL